MPRPKLKHGLSLAQRIRAFPPEVPNAVIAAELGESVASVGAERCRQRRAGHYRRKANIAQRTRRVRDAERRVYGWAYDWAQTFEAAPEVSS